MISPANDVTIAIAIAIARNCYCYHAVVFDRVKIARRHMTPRPTSSRKASKRASTAHPIRTARTTPARRRTPTNQCTRDAEFGVLNDRH